MNKDDTTRATSGCVLFEEVATLDDTNKTTYYAAHPLPTWWSNVLKYRYITIAD